MNAIPCPHPPAAGVELSRRDFMTFGGLALAAEKQAGRAADRSADDVRILNTALAADFEAVAAYEVGAKSGLLQPPVLELAVQFQDDHRQHADALAGTVRKLGGTPAEAKASYAFPTESRIARSART